MVGFGDESYSNKCRVVPILFGFLDDSMSDLVLTKLRTVPYLFGHIYCLQDIEAAV
jgi:hypothetical protein